MSERTLFLAWQDKRRTRQWFPIGRLDADVADSFYRFRYTGGAKEAQENVGFQPLWDFPDLRKDYRSPELFPLFRNRVIAPGRPDRTDYLSNLDLSEDADPIEILSVNGGSRMTDNHEVFPRLAKLEDGSFRCRFFLHGWRHANDEAQRRRENLKADEKLCVVMELTNPITGLAVQIQTEDYHMIGWTPRYLIRDLVKAMVCSPGRYSARVVRVNPAPRPSRWRVLIELSGHWPEDYEPMSSPEFQPLSPAAE